MDHSEPVSFEIMQSLGLKALHARRSQNHTSHKITGPPYPFLKWAGGKRQLLEQIHSHLPVDYSLYIEPFIGGGALFFYLLPDQAILMDINPALMNVYRVIKERVDDLIELLRHHQNTAEYYYQLRNIDRESAFSHLSDVEKASRTIYLNRCCFNGLYRVNSRGQFNVPFGKYKNPTYCDEPNLRAVHTALQNVVLKVGSFEEVASFAPPEAFVYFDPPYMPISSTASFTSYTQEDFSAEDQRKLRQVFGELDSRGCKIMLSNSRTPFINELYQGYRIHIVRAKRAINSVAAKRGEIDEVLITNF